MIGLKQQGVRVSAEVDDNYLAKRHLNYFTQVHEGDWNDYTDDHARSISTADALILSTEYLRDLYWKGLTDKFGKKDLPEFHVCRNHVDTRFIPEMKIPSREDGRLRIGYMGSDSHIWDVDLIYDALLIAYDLGHEIVFIGIDPARINPLYRRTRFDWNKIKYTHIPWSNSYRGTALPLDIGFAPLLVDRHTLGKSDIKAMEYGLSGAACVAHNCLVYNRTLKHNENVLFAGSPGEYAMQMERLIQVPKLRHELVENMNSYIMEERLIENNKQEWEHAVYG